ncbi:DUF1918 domain-containing protein [Pseudonocardia nematodicida]|uniref:DUF1918 domain-containing protein n=1 Tax=Pseudonocardia nematodicida TaxID=1206997 RepID=A0ABV1KJL5_9PSEU
MYDTAAVGDRIVVEAAIVDHGRRHGEVLEVIAGATDEPRYRVRWDDRTETIFCPGPDARVERA